MKKKREGGQEWRRRKKKKNEREAFNQIKRKKFLLILLKKENLASNECIFEEKLYSFKNFRKEEKKGRRNSRLLCNSLNACACVPILLKEEEK